MQAQGTRGDLERGEGGGSDSDVYEANSTSFVHQPLETNTTCPPTRTPLSSLPPRTAWPSLSSSRGPSPVTSR